MTTNETAELRTPASYEVFGRLMGILFDDSPLGASTAWGVRTWQKYPAGFGVSWVGGPHAIEIARLVEELANDDEVTTVLRPGDVTCVEGSESYARLHVRGYPVVLEGDDTVGLDGELLAGRQIVSSRRPVLVQPLPAEASGRPSDRPGGSGRGSLGQG